MTDPYAAVATKLTAAGFVEVEAGCFASSQSPRIIGLGICRADPEAWRSKTDELLRKERIRQALSWARYIILLVPVRKTPPLAWSAAAFAQDVSKCRRIVLFVDPSSPEQVHLPFIGLSAQAGGAEPPPSDIEAVARRVLPATLADSFLDEDLPTARFQQQAEEES
jgi:hypothetical protein